MVYDGYGRSQEKVVTTTPLELAPADLSTKMASAHVY